MKKFSTVVFTMLLAGSLAFAQNTGGDKASVKGKADNPQESVKTGRGKKSHKGGKKGHKGGKNHKKGSPGTTTPPPK